MVTIADVLRRAKVDVTVASVERSVRITASQGTKIITDKLIGEAAESSYDLIVLPVRHLAKAILLACVPVIKLIPWLVRYIFLDKILLCTCSNITSMPYQIKSVQEKLRRTTTFGSSMVSILISFL